MPIRLNNEFKLKNTGYSNYEDTVDLPRHRWYYYKEGFSPNFVKKAIEYSGITKQDIIIDPFNGSGTTTLTAALEGYSSIGVEVNPFTSFLAKAKLKNVENKKLSEAFDKMIFACEKGAKSDLVGYSTFSYRKGLDKWLFNKNVLNAFEGGFKFASSQKDRKIVSLLKLSLITSAMDNCNAIKDGKCLRYRETWKTYNYNSESFINTMSEKISRIKSDLVTDKINADCRIINNDIRKVLSYKNGLLPFKLCVTSPPYLNTFDYTDIYRPELFLGKFVYDNQELYDLRLKTVRSHIQAKWDLPINSDFGELYKENVKHVSDNIDSLMHKSIPSMIQAYFEDMHNILKQLRSKAEDRAQLWLVVSNSAYANREIPVDLIIGDIGSRVGWDLKEIGVMRKVQKRKTKHSPDITELRESVIILENNKK